MTVGRCSLSIFCSRGTPVRGLGGCCRVNSAQTRQSRSESGLGFQVKVINFLSCSLVCSSSCSRVCFKLFPLCSEADDPEGARNLKKAFRKPCGERDIAREREREREGHREGERWRLRESTPGRGVSSWIRSGRGAHQSGK